MRLNLYVICLVCNEYLSATQQWSSWLWRGLHTTEVKGSTPSCCTYYIWLCELSLREFAWLYSMHCCISPKVQCFLAKGNICHCLSMYSTHMLLKEILWNPPNIQLAVGGVIRVRLVICHAHRRTIDRCPVAPVCLRAIHISSKQCWTLSITGLGWRPY